MEINSIFIYNILGGLKEALERGLKKIEGKKGALVTDFKNNFWNCGEFKEVIRRGFFKRFLERSKRSLNLDFF